MNVYILNLHMRSASNYEVFFRFPRRLFVCFCVLLYTIALRVLRQILFIYYMYDSEACETRPLVRDWLNVIWNFHSYF